MKPSLSGMALIWLLHLPATSATGATEFEPNDTLATSTAVAISVPGEAIIGEATLGDGDWMDLDVDLYSFSIEPVASLPVRLTVDIMPDDASPVDTSLILFDANGNEVA